MNRHEQVEAAAFAIYREFIRHSIGALMPKWENGLVVKDFSGQLVPETPDEACERRWRWMSETQKDNYRREALAALEAAST